MPDTDQDQDLMHLDFTGRMQEARDGTGAVMRHADGNAVMEPAEFTSEAPARAITVPRPEGERLLARWPHLYAERKKAPPAPTAPEGQTNVGPTVADVTAPPPEPEVLGEPAAPSADTDSGGRRRRSRNEEG